MTNKLFLRRSPPDGISPANRAAGLHWTCLDRRTFASQLAMKGESLYKISKLMDNAREIGRRYYAALIPDSLAPSVEFQVAHHEVPAS